MMCLRKFLLFLILLPFPTAPPLVMILVIALMWIKLKPCVYCSILLVVVFASSCNTGFLSLSFPDAETPYWISDYTGVNSTTIATQANNASNPSSLLLPRSNTTSDELVYSAPVPNRCWCDLNRGRLLRPVLTGYRYLDDAEMLKRVKRDLKQWRAARGKDTFSRNAGGEEAGATSWARILDAISVTTNNQQQPSQSAHWWDYLPFSATRQRNARQQQQEPSRTTDGAYDPQVPEDPIQHDAESDPLMEWDGVGPVPTSSPPPAPHGKPTTTAKPRGSLTSTAFSSSYWWSYFLDKRYLDARIHGIGMVLDFGLTRSEEDVRREVWEMVDWDERQRVPGGDIDVPDKETGGAEDEAGGAEEERVSLSLEQGGSVEDGESLLSTSASFSDASTPEDTTTTAARELHPQERIETQTIVQQPPKAATKRRWRLPWMGDRRTGPNAVDEL